jgi:hypothetical protein
MRWILVGVIAICNTLGDVLNTAGMKRQGELKSLDPHSLGHMLARIFQNALVLGGLGALAVSFIALLSLLSISNVKCKLRSSGNRNELCPGNAAG